MLLIYLPGGEDREESYQSSGASKKRKNRLLGPTTVALSLHFLPCISPVTVNPMVSNKPMVSIALHGVLLALETPQQTSAPALVLTRSPLGLQRWHTDKET